MRTQPRRSCGCCRTGLVSVRETVELFEVFFGGTKHSSNQHIAMLFESVRYIRLPTTTTKYKINETESNMAQLNIEP